jgi:signal transduction histidine kinase
MPETGTVEASAARLLAATTAPVRRWPERRMIVLASAAALFVAVFLACVLTVRTGDALGDAIGLLYVIPVALVALELGLRGGVLAALAAIAAAALAMTLSGGDLDGVALLVRSATFLTAAAIAGRFSDRMRTHTSREGRLLRSGFALARLGEADSLAQLLAEHVRAAVDAASVLVELAGMPSVRLGRPAGETVRTAIVSRGRAIGSLRVSAGEGRRFAGEDRLMIETLALQAAVACENQRLLGMERERVALQAEIERTHRRLAEQFRNAGHVLEYHEQERRGIATQLHEEAAQAMAAALLTVGMLERGAENEPARPQLEEVRAHMKACIADLRRIAGSLRPAVLDEMGLAPALQHISELEAENDARAVTFLTAGLPPGLSRQVETFAYRVVEDLLAALPSTAAIEATLSAREGSLRIELDAHPREDDPGSGQQQDGGALAERLTTARDAWALDGRLTTARARVELIGGSLRIASSERHRTLIVAELPLES